MIQAVATRRYRPGPYREVVPRDRRGRLKLREHLRDHVHDLERGVSTCQPAPGNPSVHEERSVVPLTAEGRLRHAVRERRGQLREQGKLAFGGQSGLTGPWKPRDPFAVHIERPECPAADDLADAHRWQVMLSQHITRCDLVHSATVVRKDVTQNAKLNTRCHQVGGTSWRAGDENRTRVLSLGNKIRAPPRSAVLGKGAGQSVFEVTVSDPKSPS